MSDLSVEGETRFQLIRFNPIGRGSGGEQRIHLPPGFQLIRFNPIGRDQISPGLRGKHLFPTNPI